MDKNIMDVIETPQKETPKPTATDDWYDAMMVLRAHYDLTGYPKVGPGDNYPKWDFEVAYGLGLGVRDGGIFECMPSLLLFREWDWEKMIKVTPEMNLGRLRVSGEIALLYMSYSKLGLRHVEDNYISLKLMTHELRDCTFTEYPWENDDWNNYQRTELACITPFFERFGLQMNWPLADFFKQHAWALEKYQWRLEGKEPEVSEKID